MAIFDEIISQIGGGSLMEGGSRGSGPSPPQQHQQQNHHGNNLKIHSNDELDHNVRNRNETEVESDSHSTGASIIARRVKSSDVPHSTIRRTSSSSSLDKGEGPDPEHPPRAASVETDLVFATLPKKKKARGRWAGLKRIGSPLFKSRRKSFTSGSTPSYVHTNHTPSSLTASSSGGGGGHAHVPITGPSPSVPAVLEQDYHRPRTLSGLEQSRNMSHTSLQGTPPTGGTITEDAPGETKKGEEPGGTPKGILGRRGGVSPVTMERRRRSSAPRDKCLNALRLMTTFSSNQECLSSLISYICLPKCVTK